jgi:Protein of unknown function (DUF5818)
VNSSVSPPARTDAGRPHRAPWFRRARIKPLIVSLFAIASVSAAPDAQTFNGIISDDNCARGDHSRMRMGPTDAECAKACILLHGAAYVLFDGKEVYKLRDQKKPEPFAGQRVRVVGTLDAKTKTIDVETITAAK